MSDLADVEDSIYRVENALKRVEDAVKRSASPSWIGAAYVLFMVIAVSGLFDSAWHSKWRYALRYRTHHTKSQKTYASAERIE